MSLGSIINLKSNNLVCWYDASDSSTITLYSDGSNRVSQWNNKVNSLNNLQYYWIGVPTLESNQGLPYLNFPSNGGLGTSNNTMDFKDTNGNILNIGSIFMIGNVGHDNPWNVGGAGGLFAHAFESEWPIVALANKTLVQYEFNTATYYINGNLNNVQPPTTNSQGVEIYYPLNIIQINLNPGSLFNKTSFPYPGVGNIAEVLLFTNILSDLDSEKVSAYLSNKWNKILYHLPYTLCSYVLQPNELQCYQNNYPDLKGLSSKELQQNWSETGCIQNRNNQCPSFQKTSGLYNYAGCYNSLPAGSTGFLSIPDNQGIVSTIDDCQDIASKNKASVFGVQTNQNGKPECWTGSNINRAFKYNENYNRHECKNLGTKYTQQVYTLSKPFPPPPQTQPELTQTNFAGNLEAFENKRSNNFLFLFLIFLIILFFIYIYKKK
jgi:hypothetical protein